MNSWELGIPIRKRLAQEIGTLRKSAPLRVALCYPSPYSVGMSSLGYQTIYREIHLHPGATAERIFLPDDPHVYRKSKSPVFTYEGATPLGEFPVAAFSIACELEITGFFEILALSGVPLLRDERDARHPFILAGGPLTNSNPAPLAPFADLIILGEAEELIHEFLEAALSMRKEELRAHFASRPGCFAPGLSADYPAIARASDSRLPARSQILTPDSVLPSMFLIEPERGCSRGCTYCVMRRTTNGGMRLVEPEAVLSFVPEEARRVGLVGAAVTDHPRIKDVVRKVVDSGREIGISSLRADRLDRELVGLLARGGYRTLTTASDGASQRLRDAVDRKTTEQQLIRAAEMVRDFRLERLKLYQIVGLPDETGDDIDELIRFSRELAGIAPLSLGIAPFVAKRHTPLDGAPFEPVRTIELKLARLRDSLRGRVDIKPTSARWAWVEYMLSQCGEESGIAALQAWQAGGSFSAWKRAFAERGVRPFRFRPVPDGRRDRVMPEQRN
jgi:radical SAM superfamily enzyme YgiQ (UPF0313 family)